MKYLLTFLMILAGLLVQAQTPGTPSWYKDNSGQWYCIGCQNQPTETVYGTRSLGALSTPGPSNPVQARSFTTEKELQLDTRGVIPECKRNVVPLLAYEYPINGEHRMASNIPAEYIRLQGIYQFYDRPVSTSDGRIIFPYYLALTFNTEYEARLAVEKLHAVGFNTAFYMGEYRNYLRIELHPQHPENYFNGF